MHSDPRICGLTLSWAEKCARARRSARERTQAGQWVRGAARARAQRSRRRWLPAHRQAGPSYLAQGKATSQRLRGSFTSSFQTHHFPLEPPRNAPREAKSVVSAEHTIPAMPAPNRWRSAEKAVPSARLDRMEGIAMPAAFAPSLLGQHRAKISLY